MQAKKERLDYIDCAKGIGILLVVVAHHLQDSENVLWWIYSFHMPLFFIITGYLYEELNKKTTVKEAIISGVKTLMYPYCTFSVVLILWWIVFGSVFQTEPEEPLVNIVLRLLSTYGYHAMWFLPTMFEVSVVSKTFKHRERVILLAISVVSGCVLSNMANSTELRLGYWRYVVMYIGRFMLALSFAEIGRYVHTFVHKLSGKMEWIVLVVSIGVSLILYHKNILVSMAFSRIGNPIIYYITACTGSLCILLLSKKIAHSKIAQGLCFWGKNSLITMALHMDISIEIAWVILGISKLSTLLSFRMASILAILIELVLLFFAIKIINRYASFLICLQEKRERLHSVEE